LVNYNKVNYFWLGGSIIVNFSGIVKELRIKAGMTQKDVADKLGVTKSVVSYYELAERSPSPEILMKFADLFHVTTDFLLGREKRAVETVDLTELEEEDKAMIYSLVELLRRKNKK